MSLIFAKATMMRLVKSSQTNSQGLKANATCHEMCLFYADFKHFQALRGRYFQPLETSRQASAPTSRQS
jgi:hypothetical protein